MKYYQTHRIASTKKHLYGIQNKYNNDPSSYINFRNVTKNIITTTPLKISHFLHVWTWRVPRMVPRPPSEYIGRTVEFSIYAGKNLFVQRDDSRIWLDVSV